MSDTQDQSHFTVEDAGTTTDAADLANSGVGHAGLRDEDPVESADEVVRATDGVPAADAAPGAVAEEPASTQPIDEPAEATAATQDDNRAVAQQQQEEFRQDEPTQQAAPSLSQPAAASAAPTAAHGDLSALAGTDFGHVFDQTNGVIDHADGDSDGSAESDAVDGDRSGWGDPFIDEAGVHGDGEAPESRRTGD